MCRQSGLLARVLRYGIYIALASDSVFFGLVPVLFLDKTKCFSTIINRAVGLIFSFSVHHRNAVLGTGYPLPITLTQKESSSLGTVFRTNMGKSSSRAFISIFFKTSSTYVAIIGFSTIVSLHTTYTGLLS